MFQSKRGFTFVELIVSLALLALFASVVIPVSEISSRQRKENELKQSLKDIRQALDAYKAASDQEIISAQFRTVSGYPPNLNVLTGVPGQNNGGLPLRFLRQIPRDPFYDDAKVMSENTWHQRAYLSDPDKPQKGEDIYDVYSASTEIGTNGVMYSQW